MRISHDLRAAARHDDEADDSAQDTNDAIDLGMRAKAEEFRLLGSQVYVDGP
jgi:hypothetical protein